MNKTSTKIHAMHFSKKFRTICGCKTMASILLKTATCPSAYPKTYTKPSLLLVASVKKKFNFINFHRKIQLKKWARGSKYNVYTNTYKWHLMDLFFAALKQLVGRKFLRWLPSIPFFFPKSRLHMQQTLWLLLSWRWLLAHSLIESNIWFDCFHAWHLETKKHTHIYSWKNGIRFYFNLPLIFGPRDFSNSTISWLQFMFDFFSHVGRW